MFGIAVHLHGMDALGNLCVHTLPCNSILVILREKGLAYIIPIQRTIKQDSHPTKGVPVAKRATDPGFESKLCSFFS